MFAGKIQRSRASREPSSGNAPTGAAAQHIHSKTPNAADPGVVELTGDERERVQTGVASGSGMPAWMFKNTPVFAPGDGARDESSSGNQSRLTGREAEATLSLGQPGRELEHEADGLAAEVTMELSEPRGSESSSPADGVRAVKAAAPDGGGEVCLAEVKGPMAQAGKAPDASVRGAMERRLGWDFSRVRIHADEVAARAAERLRARAYTLGTDVVFSAGAYAPGTPLGQRLLAHELVHVAQQASGAVMIQRAPANKPPTRDPQSAPPTAEEQQQIVRGMQEALGIPLTPEDIWQELLRRRAEPLSSPASVVAEAPKELDKLDKEIAEKTTAFKKARGKSRAALGGELKELRTKRQRLARGRELGAFGEGRAAGTGEITYAGIQVQDAQGRRLALEFAETTGREHAEEVIVETLRDMITGGRLRASNLEGGRLLVVGDQFVCASVGRCRTRLGEFAKRFKLRSVESTVFQRQSLTEPGVLASPRTTLRTMTKASSQSAPLMRADETLYFDASKGSGGPGPHSSAPRPVNLGEASQPAGEHAVGGAAVTEKAPATTESGETVATGAETSEGAEGALGGATKGAWKGTATRVGGFVVPMVLGTVHQRATISRVEKQKKETGYVPPGSYEGGAGGVIDRLGDIIYDPTQQAQRSVPLGQRLDVKVWRKKVRDYFAGHKPGDQVTYHWDKGPGKGEIEVTYTLGSNGRWIESEHHEDIIDINWVLSPDTSDQAILDWLGGAA